MDQLRKSRPTPQFFSESQTFSTKKARGTPINSGPPPLPYKSAPPPASRVFRRPLVQRAQAVSFRDSDCSMASRHYNESSQDLYFDQCFHVESKIGVGSFGEVFKVRSIEDGKYYAVKRSRERFRGETDRRHKLEEVRKHEELPKHSNCIRFIKAWEERQHLYIQTELCDISLSDFCEINHDIPEALVWNYTIDLLQAINHLHTHDLIHLDIKPENIFLSSEGICKLGDFGLVHDMKKGDLSDAQEGDPKYLAPELMRGNFSKAADVFSLGITILEMAADLNLPRGGNGWHQLRSGYIPLEFTNHLSQELKEVIQAMMNPNYKDRVTAAQLLTKSHIQKKLRRRARINFFKLLMSQIKSKIASVFLMIATVWHFISYPILKVTSKKQSIQTPSPVVKKHNNHPEWDLSLSDDDVFDPSLNLSNSMIGTPSLNGSYAEENEGPHHRRFANSTPALKQFRSSPSFQQPNFLPGNSSFNFDGSLGSLNTSAVSQDSSFHTDFHYLNTFEDARIPSARCSIDPKNLMSVFDASSDDESGNG